MAQESPLERHIDLTVYRQLALAAITLLLFGLISIATANGATAQSTESPPSVGDIAVDNYDCMTGELDFHVPVANLPHMPPSQGNGYPVSYTHLTLPTILRV